MAGEALPAKPAGGGALSRLGLWLLVLALLAAVWWLASERNARRFTTEVREGRLVVGRGRFFPLGSRALGPEDGALFQLYQPLPLPAGVKPPPDREYEDQSALDQGLFAAVAGAARQAAQRPDAAALGQADALAERAAQFPGLSSAQLSELRSLRGELALTAARGSAVEALKLVRAARARLGEALRVGSDRTPQLEAFAAALDSAASSLDGAAARTAPAGPPAEPGAEPAAPAPAGPPPAAPGAAAPPRPAPPSP